MKRAIIFLFFAAAFVVFSRTAVAQVQGPGGHYYKVVLEPGLLWEEARARAAESTLNGVHGYLATITSAEEDQFIENLRIEAAPAGQNSLWVGGSQLSYASGAAEGWFWENGEGQIPTMAAQSGYANWQPGEPNDYWGPKSESYLSIGHFNIFGWNDEPNDHNVQGYVVEYPGGGTVTTVRVAAIDPIATERSNEATPSPSPLDTAVFLFSREGDVTLDLPVYYSVHGTASNGGDYNEISRTVIIPAGQSSVRLEIVPRTDVLTVVEKMETVGIRLEMSQILTPSAAYKIDTARREAVAVIFENSPPPRTVVEIGVPRTGFAYNAGDAVVVMAALSSTGTVSTATSPVDIYIDNVKFGTATLDNSINNLHFYKFTWPNPTPGTHTIVARASVTMDNPPASTPVTISIPGTPQPTTVAIRFIEPTSTEPVPNADYAPGYVAVVRDIGDTAHDLQVFYSVSGTATAGIDYEELQGYVVIPAGKTGAKIVVTAKDDTIDEPNETVILTLIPAPANAANPIDTGSVYNIDPNYKAAQVVILDNDNPPGPAFLVSITATHEETIENGTSPGTFRIAREGGSVTQPLTVVLQYSGTATPGEDYAKLSESVVIPAGSFAVEVQVRPIDDQLVEGQETVIATLAPLRGVLYNIAQNANTATVRIIDNDVPMPGPTVVTIHATDAEATEFPPTADGFNPARFLIERTGSTANDLQVFYSIHGTAKNGEDYERISSPVTISAGKSSAEIQIVPLSDRVAAAHKYEIVMEGGLTWEQARLKAEEMSYEGVEGHLATITSAAEDELIESLRMEAGGPHLWVGGYQEPGETSTNGGWKWINNEGPIPGSNESVTGYANWRSGEPNDYWGPGSENQMVIG
ncbi:MAG TPA: Calx-beta domain-containing protein, partial [Verrucomicrobiae bacterium]|nr:Calx-beta domain-containing protein [Verrucomicrobiae bacterium]